MGNKFDMISAAESGSINNLNLLNETFHVFSKSPASNVTTLGGARLKSGHTTTASDVWADEIPAFFSAANQAKFDLFSTLAVKDDLCIFGGKVYQHNGTQFVSLGTEAEVLVDGATFQKNNKDVIKYHKNRTAINLTADNNNGDGSNDLSAKIYDAATGSTNFVSQFISSTDKMVAGVPSLAYDATVVAGGVKLAEGLTNDNDYICNAYAGVIQFNKARSSGVTVSAWEYIGDKLTTSISSIRQSIKDISDVTLKGVVASVNADENTAQKAGITVDNSITTTPVIKFTAGSVAANETKLVTGGAVKTYVDTAISDATLTSGDNAIASATSDTATKLVTAEQVKEYVDENAKVTLTAGTGISIPNGGTPGTSFEVSIASDYLVKASDVTAISDRVTTLETVTVPELEGTISGVSQAVADIETSLSTGTIHDEIAAAKSAADAAMEEAQKKVASVTGPTTGLVTVTGDKDVTITVSDEIATKTDAATAASTAIITSLAGTTTDTIGGAITSAVSGLETKLTTGEGSLGAKVTALEGSVKTINETTIPNAITTAQNGAVTTVKALTLSATDSDDAAKVTVTLGGTVETPTITVTSSDIASAQTLSELSSKVNTHIEEAAGLYLSVEKVSQLPADAEAKSNKIYLVPVDTEEGREQNIHTEYIWTNGQWEVIGTTAIDMNSLESAAAAAQAAADKAQGEVDAVEEAIAAMDADLTVNGISVKQVDGKVTELSEALITASVPANTTSVEGNVAYVGSTKHVIAPEKFQTAATMPNTLTSWVADLSNLVTGDSMFAGCTSLTTFIGDLSSLTSATNMFNGCTLDAESLEILAENLPTVSGGTIDIGASTNATEEVIATIQGKGWTVTSNGTGL